MSDNLPLLHIYGQEIAHDDVQIIGNREGLLRLLYALQDELFGAFIADDPGDVMTADGEYYHINVTQNDSEWLNGGPWSQLELPYSDKGIIDWGDEK